MAVMTALLTLLTLISREWIEVVFGVGPDGGSGTLEWALVAAGFSATAVSSVMARLEWTRRRRATAP